MVSFQVPEKYQQQSTTQMHKKLCLAETDLKLWVLIVGTITTGPSFTRNRDKHSGSPD